MARHTWKVQLDGSGKWRAIGLATFIVAAFLLLSMGGAVVAAPVTIPLMWISSDRHPTRSFRWAACVLATLTAAELSWAAAYITVEEARPWIWLLPAVVAAGVATAFARRHVMPPLSQ